MNTLRRKTQMKGKKLLWVLASSLLILTSCGPKPGPSSSDKTNVPSGGDSSSIPSGSDSGASDSGELPPEPAQPANGAFSYAQSSSEDRTNILGVLEKWAVESHLTGLTIYEDGGYVMYNPVVEKGAPNYIKGFGYGILSEGRLTGDLEGEPEAKYKRYYHSFASKETDNLIYMDDDTSITELGYLAGGLYETIMNSTRTGYKWVGDLARNNEPVAVDPDEAGASTVYRVPVKTGDTIKYSTLTEDNDLKAFNNRPIALDDYLTPYKIYYTKAYGMKRNAEVKDATKGSLKNGSAYVAASANGFNESEFAKLGVKVGNNAELGDYIEFTFNEAYTPFWARYYISSSMFAPVPAAFIEALGNKVADDDFEDDNNSDPFSKGLKIWGKWSKNTDLSPKDTFLSTGPYNTEVWQKGDGKAHIFSRNPNYVSGDDVAVNRLCSYNIIGIHLATNTAINNDKEAGLKEFLANKLHAVGIPSTKIQEYANDPRTTIVPGEDTTKLNFNTCDQESWEALFGENGSIVQTPTSKYWKLKPAMSNKHFLDGICYAFDRKTFAASVGATPSNDYFGSAYYSDAEEGVFYNDTDAHKNAVAESLAGTDGYGYSEEKAIAAFKLAAQEMIENGDYEVGGKIEIEMGWWMESWADTYAVPITNMIKKAFDAANTGLTLDVKHWYAPAGKITDIYYTKMMVGQFDIAYGGVNGNYYDPLNFMEVLKSDNSSTFTLNWGIPTNEKAELEWDGKLWTYDALWEVADHGGYVENGKNVTTFDAKDLKVTRDAAGDVTLDVKVLTKDVENFKTELIGIALFGTTNDEYTDYAEIYLLADGTVGFGPKGEYANYATMLYPDAAGSFEFGDTPDADGYISVKIKLNAAFINAFYNCVVDLFGKSETPFSDSTTWYRLGFDFYSVTTLFGVSGDPVCALSLYINDGLPAIPGE